MKKAAALVVLLTLVVPVSASGSNSELAQDPRVKQALRLYAVWVEAKLACEEIPGIALGLVFDQELIWS